MYIELTLESAVCKGGPLIPPANYWYALCSITGFHPTTSLAHVVILFSLYSDTIALPIALSARASAILLLCGCILFGGNIVED